GHQREQGLLVRHVVVERAGLDAEGAGDPPHRAELEPVLVEDTESSADDVIEGVGHATTLYASLNTVQVNTVQESPMTTTSPTTGRLGATDLALVSAFAALIAACALLPAIHVGAGIVPITLQTFGVLLAGAVLGAKRGFLAVLLYLAVGAAGLPVFSGGAAGLAVFAGPSAGYLIGFPLAAALC